MNTNDYVLLGLLSIHPMTGYEMKKWAENNLSHFWKISYGQIYPAMSRFIEQELVLVEEVQAEKLPSSKKYSLTEKGKLTLSEWLKLDAYDINVKDESQIKFYFSGIEPIEEVIEKAQRALDYNEELLKKYSKTSEKMRETKVPTRHELNQYMAVRKGILLNEARVAWAKEYIETLKWYQKIKDEDQ